jgi:hypothetical protein
MQQDRLSYKEFIALVSHLHGFRVEIDRFLQLVRVEVPLGVIHAPLCE